MKQFKVVWDSLAIDFPENPMWNLKIIWQSQFSL